MRGDTEPARKHRAGGLHRLPSSRLRPLPDRERSAADPNSPTQRKADFLRFAPTPAHNTKQQQGLEVCPGGSCPAR